VSGLKAITDQDFEAAVFNAGKPVLVYFWATWCGPCRLVSPALEQLAETYGERLQIVKLELDPSSTIVAQYKVEGLPALRLFQGQTLLLSHEGALTKPQIQALIDEHLPA
jgi:thioredoxin 1